MTEADLDKLADLKLPTGAAIAEDSDNQPVVLFPSEWSVRYFTERNVGVALHPTPAKRLAETETFG